jgi:hypothetical protein
LSHVLEQPAVDPAPNDAARRANGVVLLGVLLVAAATAVRALLLDRTWFYLDDFALITQANEHPLSPMRLTEPYFGHLMPAGRLLADLVVASGRFEYATAMIELVTLFATAGLAVLHLLVTLFGSRRAILAPLAYFLASPLLIPATSWWAAGINHLPALTATAMALAAFVRHLRDNCRRDLVATVGWLLAGLCFTELTMFAYLSLAFLALGYFATGTLGQRTRQVWDKHRPGVVALGLTALGYLAVYFQRAWETLPTSAKIDWSAFFTNAGLVSLPTAAVGGPGGWHVAWAAQLEAHPSGLTRLVAYAVVATVVTISMRTRDCAKRAWLLPLGQGAVCVVLVAKTRVLFGPGIALDLRFYTPLALGITLALGLAFLPVVGATETAERRSSHWLIDRPAPQVVAVAAFTVFAWSSASAFPLLHLGERAPRPWFDGVDRSITEHPGPIELQDLAAPARVIAPPEGLYSHLLAPYGNRLIFPVVVQDDWYVVDNTGRLVHPDLDVARRAQAPAPANCGFPVGSDRTVPLDGPVFGYGWRVRITYTSGRETGATISVGNVDTDISLSAGEHVLELPGDAEYESVRFSGVDPAAGLCLSEILVGTTQLPE